MIECPLTRTAPPADPAALRRVAARADSFDWAVFSSVRGVEAFVVARRGRRPIFPAGMRVAAVGAATARAVRDAGGRVSFQPKDESAAGLVADWPDEPQGSAIFVPRAEKGRHELVLSLRQRGARVTEVVAYRTVARPAPLPVVRGIVSGRIDAVVVQAPSAVASLRASARSHRLKLSGTFLAIAGGKTTAAAAARLRPRNLVVSARPTPEALAEAVVSALRA